MPSACLLPFFSFFKIPTQSSNLFSLSLFAGLCHSPSFSKIFFSKPNEQLLICYFFCLFGTTFGINIVMVDIMLSSILMFERQCHDFIHVYLSIAPKTTPTGSYPTQDFFFCGIIKGCCLSWVLAGFFSLMLRIAHVL